MAYVLADAIHACVDDGVPIFIDLAADRYFRLRPDEEPAFLRLVSGGPHTDDDRATLARLVEAGVLQETIASPPQGASLLTTAPPIIGTLAAAPNAPPLLALRMIWMRLRKRRQQRRQPKALLGRAIRRAAQTGAPLSPEAHVPDAIAPLLAAQRLSDMLLSPAGHCLERALSLHDLLFEAGATPRLVLGVVARPFTAHCWVQQGHWLLGDSIEHVRAFTPIAVL